MTNETHEINLDEALQTIGPDAAAIFDNASGEPTEYSSRETLYAAIDDEEDEDDDEDEDDLEDEDLEDDEDEDGDEEDDDLEYEDDEDEDDEDEDEDEE